MLLAGGVIGWAIFGFVTTRYLVISAQSVRDQPFLIHYDWHAYVAGAHDLVDRSLYREPLTLGTTPLPLDAFNLPPLAALEAAVVLPIGITPGGLVWQSIGAAGVALAVVTLPRLGGAGWWTAVLVGGVLLGGYLVVDHVLIADEASYWWGLVLGTNNYLMLGLLAAFALALRLRADAPAGVLLGIAIATKLWPIALGVWLVRERRWRVAAWAGAALAVQALVWLVWLGPDVVPLAARALLRADEQPQTIIGVAALRAIFDWWPGWAGWVVGAALVALPVRGWAGMGLGLLAGMAVITNLWGHYLPTVLFALGLIAIELAPRLRWSAIRR